MNCEEAGPQVPLRRAGRGLKSCRFTSSLFGNSDGRDFETKRDFAKNLDENREREQVLQIRQGSRFDVDISRILYLDSCIAIGPKKVAQMFNRLL